jgi:hypothetical protein
MALRLDRPPDPLIPHFEELGAVYAGADGFDAIHVHTDFLSLPFARGCATSSLLTLHGRLDLPYLGTFFTNSGSRDDASATVPRHTGAAVPEVRPVSR